MKTVILLLSLYAFFYGQALYSIDMSGRIVDVNRIEDIILKIKKEQEPLHYFITEKTFALSDISFSYPDSIPDHETYFDVTVKWKEQIIFLYAIDIVTYEIKHIVDLR